MEAPECSYIYIFVIWTLFLFLFQLEASIKNGDIQGFQLFSKAANHLSSMTRRKDHSKGHEGISEEVLATEPRFLEYGGWILYSCLT